MNSNNLDLKRKKELSIVIMLFIMFLMMLLMVTSFTFESIFGIESPGKGKYHIKFDGDGIPDINIRKNIITNINIDTDGDGNPDVNIDTNRDGIPDLNIDFNKDGIPDVNIDTNGDNKGDKNKINIDTNRNGRVDLNVDLNGDGYPDINIDVDGDGKPDINIDTSFWTWKDEQKVDALFTIITAENLNLNVKAEDLSKDAVGDKEYIEISSKTEKTRIALKSSGDTTTCKYNVSFITTENTFENRYLTNSGAFDTLKNQIILRLKGFEMVNGELVPKTYDIDLNEYKNNNYMIKDILITNKESDNDTTEHSWDLNLIFRNYRDYNQKNNSNKKMVGKLNFNITECQRIVKG